MGNEQAKDTILIVDDDSSNLTTAQGILSQDYSLAAAKSGLRALQYLERHTPGLILMDINMPEMDGFEAVAKIKADDRLKGIPVIFLTADKNPETEEKCFNFGAVDYVAKPFLPGVLRSRVARTLELEHYRKNLEGIIEQQSRQLTERAERLNRMQEEVILGMTNLIENRDGRKGRHVQNTQTYVKMIVGQLRKQGLFADELDEATAGNIVRASLLHDIGKIKISDSILLEQGNLTPEEFDIMKLHTVYGGEVIREVIANVEDTAYTEMAIQIANFHHERWDGMGYPAGLSGYAIPLGARIMAVADGFDELYEAESAKDAANAVDNAMRIMLENRDIRFDGAIVDAFAVLVPELKEYLAKQ